MLEINRATAALRSPGLILLLSIASSAIWLPDTGKRGTSLAQNHTLAFRHDETGAPLPSRVETGENLTSGIDSALAPVDAVVPNWPSRIVGAQPRVVQDPRLRHLHHLQGDLADLDRAKRGYHDS